MYRTSLKYSGILILLLIFSQILVLFPSLYQTLYIKLFFPIISKSLRWISGLVSFSISELIYLSLIIFSAYFIVKILIKKKQRNQTKAQARLDKFIKLGNFILTLYLIYTFTWGLNYSRASIGEQLKLQKTEIQSKELYLLTQYLIANSNNLIHSNEIQKFNAKALKQLTLQNYQLFSQSNPNFTYTQPALKSTLFPKLWSHLGIEGYYNPITAEANYNPTLVAWVSPFVTAHEIAHQFGIAYEDEANLLAYLVCKSSPNSTAQYAANYSMLRYLLMEVAYTNPKDYEALYKSLDPKIQNHFQLEQAYWKNYNAQMSKFMSLSFDQFLKFNNQEEGIKSYSRIIYWLWEIHKKEILNTKN